MNRSYDRILVVLFLGSVWGAFEVFGYRGLTLLAVPHKSPFLFAFAIMTMVAAKRIAPFSGSALIMAVIAGFYKVLTLSLPACGSNAVMALLLDAAAFEVVYAVLKNYFDSGFLKGAALAILITFIAYSAFGVYAIYINPEGTAASRTFNGVLNYLFSSGSLAAILTIFTFNLGLVLGKSLWAVFSLPPNHRGAALSRALATVLMIGLWMMRLTK